MIKHQLELPRKQLDEALGKGLWGFSLPHGKRPPAAAKFPSFPRRKRTCSPVWISCPCSRVVKPETHDPYALDALATVAPDEARPIIIEDIQREHPIYILSEPKTPFGTLALFALESCRPGIAGTRCHASRKVAPSFARLGGTGSKPGVDRALWHSEGAAAGCHQLYQAREGRWACASQDAMLLMAADPAGGVAAALDRTLQRNGPHDTGCFRMVLTDVLRKSNGSTKRLLLVLVATQNTDRDVVRSATQCSMRTPGQTLEYLIKTIRQDATAPQPAKQSAMTIPTNSRVCSGQALDVEPRPNRAAAKSRDRPGATSPAEADAVRGGETGRRKQIDEIPVRGKGALAAVREAERSEFHDQSNHRNL